jgi:DNA-binding transcriptional MerR regulator
MNNKAIFSRAEFLAKFNLPERTLCEWEKLKLLRPVGFSDDKIPLYSEEMTEQVWHIQKLNELGYGPEEIQKIIKKVGLPKPGLKKRKAEDLDKYLTVGNLAERVGLSPRTIKHWEDKGIIEPDMRSEGGFRLYSEAYVYLCELIRDLQLFGYTLEEIKMISDYFRDFLGFQKDLASFPKDEVSLKLDVMLREIKILFDKMELLSKGIERWEDLAKRKKKEVLSLKDKNLQRKDGKEERKRP